MTLRRFIDVGYAILVEEYQRIGIDLLSAIEKLSALGTSSPAADPSVPAPSENERSMSMLTSMMAGVSRG